MILLVNVDDIVIARDDDRGINELNASYNEALIPRILTFNNIF